MIDADDAERRASGSFWKLDRHGGLCEDGVDVVDGDGIVWVGGLHWLLAMSILD